MQEIKLYKLENFIKEKCVEPCVIVGEPCEKLLTLQEKGDCVLAELKHLQGLSDEEIAEALCKEDAVVQYKNVCIDASQLPQAYFRRIWCRHIGEPVLIAETERLIIRESVEADAEAFLDLYRDEACQKYLEMPPVELNGDRAHDLAEYRRYIAQYQAGQYGFYEYGMWSIVERVSGRCIGRAGLELQAEGPDAPYDKDGSNGNTGALNLGYALLPQFRGKGYATEACFAILEYCKECEYAECVAVKIDAENVDSLSVYRKLQKQSPIAIKLA